MPALLNRPKAWARHLRAQLRETVVCLALGLKDSLRWTLLWRGVLLAMALALLWLTLFVWWREEIWSVSLVLGGGGTAVYLHPFIPSVAPSVGNVGVGGVYFLMFMAAVIVLAPVAAVLLIIVTFAALLLLSFRILAVRSLFPRVKSCIERQYPMCHGEGSPVAGLSWLQQLRLLLTAVIGTAVCLLLPLTGGLFLLLWIGYLSTRSMALKVLKGQVSGDDTLHLIRQSRLPLTLIGSCMTVLLLVPLFGLLAPTAMTAAAAHLMKRSQKRWIDASVT